MTAANETPTAQVVLHPKATMHRVAGIRDAGYRFITYRGGYWRTVHHAIPAKRARREAPTSGFRPGPPTGGGPGGGKAA